MAVELRSAPRTGGQRPGALSGAPAAGERTRGPPACWVGRLAGDSLHGAPRARRPSFTSLPGSCWCEPNSPCAFSQERPASPVPCCCSSGASDLGRAAPQPAGGRRTPGRPGDPLPASLSPRRLPPRAARRGVVISRAESGGGGERRQLSELGLSSRCQGSRGAILRVLQRGSLLITVYYWDGDCVWNQRPAPPRLAPAITCPAHSRAPTHRHKGQSRGPQKPVVYTWGGGAV